MIINLLCFVAGFIVCLCLPNTKYKKAKAELAELTDKIKDRLDGDNDKAEEPKEEVKTETPKTETI